ncbi:MAG: VCBS domain-containing protein, partial [Methylococcaceae bacterium]
ASEGKIPEDSLPEAANIRLTPTVLTDPNGDTPSLVRILSVEGGSLATADGSPLTLGTEGSVLTLVNGSLDLRFTPELNRATDARFTYAIVDSIDPQLMSAESTATVPIAPVNDLPIITSTPVSTATVGEAYTYTLTATDVDTDTHWSITAEGLPTGLTFTDQGDGQASLSGTPDKSTVGLWPITLHVSDGTATVDQTFSLDIQSHYTPPTVDEADSTLTGTQTENATVALNGEVTLQNLDPTATLTVTPALKSVVWAGGTLTAEQQAGFNSALTLDTATADTVSGKTQQPWRFTAPSGLDFLKQGETLTATYTVTVDDGQGATLDQDITLTITGTNDLPTFTADGNTLTGAYTELDRTTASSAPATLKGQLSFSDPDLNDVFTVSQAVKSAVWSGGALPDAAQSALATAMTLDAAITDKTTGKTQQPWTFNTPDSTFDFLKKGDTLTAIYTVSVDDGQGGKLAQDVTITVTGSLDEMTLVPNGNTTGTYTELDASTGSATPASLKGQFSYTAAEASASLTATSQTKTLTWSGGTLTADQQASFGKALSLDTATTDKTTGQTQQAWTFTTPDSRLDFLKKGDTLTAVYTVTVNDGLGNTLDQDVTVTVTGSNDVPTLDKTGNTLDGKYTELDLTTASTTAATLKGTLSFSDPDLNDTLTVSSKTKTLTWSGGTVPTSTQTALDKALSLDTAITDKTTG